MLFFEDKPLAMRIIALFLMKFVPEGLALRTRVSFASCWAYAMTVKYFFCCNVNCPEFHSWKPGESCKVSAVNNIFHSDKHKCIVPGVKYCWVYQSQVAGWTLHTKGSQAMDWRLDRDPSGAKRRTGDRHSFQQEKGCLLFCRLISQHQD